MRQHVSVFVLALVVPFTLFLTACDSGGANEETVDNEFTLTIEPTSTSSSAVPKAQEEEINGFSFFYDAENPETNEQAFGIYLSDAESFSQQEATDGLFGFIARDGSRPAPDTYTFGDLRAESEPSGFVGVLYKDFTNFQSAPFYLIESGTLTIETSSDDEVAGSIEASGTKITQTGSSFEEEPVTITGSFSAKDVETFVPFDAPGL